MPKRLSEMTGPELGALMKHAAGQVERALPGRTCFFLLAFETDEEGSPGPAQYIANVGRPGAIQALRECADRLERRETLERISFEGGGAN